MPKSIQQVNYVYTSFSRLTLSVKKTKAINFHYTTVDFTNDYEDEYSMKVK